MAARTLTLADGRLGASAASVFGGGDAPPSGRVTLILANTGNPAQTVLLTFQRAGGTARRVARAELAVNESLIVRGLPIEATDTLLGEATGADAVDYLVLASDDSDFTVEVKAADGTPKRSDNITVTLSERAGLTADGITITGLLEQAVELLRQIA